MTENISITSIPKLISIFGTIKNTHRKTGLSESTVAKYQHDYDMKHHAIVNSRLMSAAISSRVIKNME